MMMPCRKCGLPYDAKPYQARRYDWICLHCQRVREAARRRSCRIAGKPIRNLETERAWRAAYYQRPDVRARRLSNALASQERHALRVTARRRLRHEIEMGRIARKPCEACGNPRTQAHHDDYAKPLDVRWLCSRHHVEHHVNARTRDAGKDGAK